MPSRHLPALTLRGRRHRWRRPLSVFVASLAALAIATPALAGWNASGFGNGRAKATSLTGGNTPTLTVTGRNVTLTWTATPLANLAGNATGYVITRYSPFGFAQPIGSDCSGTINALTCTETGVPSGTWSYSVTPKYQSWTGDESARAWTGVESPSFTRTSAAFVDQDEPGTFTGTTGNFVGGLALTFRLDSPFGPLLSGTPATTSAGGSDSVSVTLPTGMSFGTHVIYAMTASNDERDSASFTVGQF